MDWIDVAAEDIASYAKDRCDQELPAFPFYADPIAEIIRRHAPAWHDRPTCAGLWLWVRFSPDGKIIESDMFHADIARYTVPDVRWYGPIPEIPVTKGGAK